ncbi:MAG: ABC transporter ATP-binding protein [Acidimicrobiales bacterium]
MAEADGTDRVLQRSRVPAADGLVIETAGLTKRFGNHAAVDGIDLRVPEGSVFGFLGPNGSGKTTTIRMLLGLAYPSSGQVRLLGKEIPALAGAVLPEVGAVVEGPAFYPWLSGRANLSLLDSVGPHPGGGARGRADRVDGALARVGLLAAADKRYRRYSLGMRQRLAIAGALVRRCRLLVLDEPTNGLDPQGMREVRGLIRGLATEGTSIFISSHLLSEVEQICTHAAVMRAGRIVAQGSLDELRAGHRAQLRVETPDVDLARRTLDGIAGVGVAVAAEGGDLQVELLDALAEDVNAALVNAGVRVRGLQRHATSLEDAFVALTGEGFDVDG